MPRKTPNVLVIQPLPGMGDIFWFDDAVQSLFKHYKAPVTLLTKQQSQAHKIYEGSSYVSEVLWVDRSGLHSGIRGLFRLAQTLKQKQFTHVWILHKSWRYKLVAQLAKIACVFTLPKEAQRLHPTKRAAVMLPHYGVAYHHGAMFPVEVTATKTMAIYAPPQNKKNIVFAIGGTEIEKKWPLKNWIELGKRLIKKDYFITILGGPKEAEEAIDILTQLNHKDVQVCTDLTILQSLALLQKHDTVVGNDTGMMNAAVILNKKVYALFLGSPPLSYRESLVPIQGPTKGEISVDQVQQVLDDDLALSK
jgi:ADP-heptose:LPS heptosyltransferase